MPMRSSILLAALVGQGALAVRHSSVKLQDATAEQSEADADLPEYIPGERRRKAWKFNSTKQVSHEEIGRCYNPDADWEWSGQTDAFWEEAFGEAVMEARENPEQPHAQTLMRGLGMFGPFAFALPYHRAVALTTHRVEEVEDGMYYPDSQCFKFDYDSFQPGDPDPYGCGFFKKSFQPMKELRQCIVGKLEGSSHWQSYKAVADQIKASRVPGSKDVVNPAVVDDEDQHVIGTAHMKVIYDSIRRADEIVKVVSFKPWEKWDMARIKGEIEKKIKKTVITEEQTSVLEDEVIESIRRDCFLVPDDAGSEDSISPTLLTMKKAMPCYQLMWDQIEVPGAPEQPTVNAAGMYDVSLKYKTSVDKNHHLPPICARSAMSLIVDKQKRAPKRYSALSCLHRCPSWEDCMKPEHFNCICLSCCFQAALRRVCEINEGCCDTEP